MFKVHSLHWPDIAHPCAAAKYVFSLVGGRICNGHVWESPQKFPPHPQKKGWGQKPGNRRPVQAIHAWYVCTQLPLNYTKLVYSAHVFMIPLPSFPPHWILTCLNEGFSFQWNMGKSWQIYQPWMTSVTNLPPGLPASPRCWRKKKD